MILGLRKLKILISLLMLSQFIGAQDKVAFQKTIAEVADFNAGFVVYLNCKDPALSVSILKAKPKVLIHVLGSSKEMVGIIKNHLVDEHLYGQITADQYYDEKLPYEPSLVNMIYVDQGALTENMLKEIFRVLTPKGKLLVNLKISKKDTLNKLLTNIGFIDIQIINKNWIKAIKPRPKNIDDWTHFNYDASSNRVSKDKLSGPPRSIRWLSGQQYGNHVHTGPKLVSSFVSSQGINYYFSNEKPLQSFGASQMALIARDAFNGLFLWRIRLPVNMSASSPTMLIATEDKVYTQLKKNGPLVQLDGKTGALLQTYTGSEKQISALFYEGKLIVSGRGPFMCFDANTAKLLWRSTSKTNRSQTVGHSSTDGQIFRNSLIYKDRLLYLNSHHTKSQPRTIGAIDLKTGVEIYDEPILFTTFRGLALVAVKEGVLIIGESYAGKSLHAVSTLDGKHLWSHSYKPLGHGGRHTEGFFIGNYYWNHVNDAKGVYSWQGLNVKTGKIEKTLKYPKAIKVTHRCHMDRATEKYFIGGSMDLYGLDEEKHFPIRFTRGSCQVGSVPAQGLLFTAPNGCGCEKFLRGFQGLSSEDAEKYFKENKSLRLEKGSSYDLPLIENENWAWPIFRGDKLRGSSSIAKTPLNPKILWQIDSKEELLAPVMGNGFCLVASKSGKIILYELEKGVKVWEYVAGGAFDSPPTIYKGRVFAGCQDGWVYSLSLKDGKLAWRFRAAPIDRRIIAYGDLESRWPVSGSVMVEDNTVTFVAGRHSSVDGGIVLYSIKADTGEMIWKKRISHVGKKGVLSDLLVSNGKGLFLGRQKINRKDGSIMAYQHLYPQLRIGGGRSTLLHMSWMTRRGVTVWSNGNVSGQFLAYNSNKTISFSVLDNKGTKGSTWGANRPGLKDYRVHSYKGKEKLWSKNIGVRARSMILTASQIILAGSPDPVIKELEGAEKFNKSKLYKIYRKIPREKLYPKSGQVVGLSSEDGTELWSVGLPSHPIDHGLAVSENKIIVITIKGEIFALGK